jgi:hypothetical protein
MGSEQDSLETSLPAEDTRSSSDIKSDIRRTRSRLDDTLENLNERLSPRSLINDVLSCQVLRSGGQRSNQPRNVMKLKSFRQEITLVALLPHPPRGDKRSNPDAGLQSRWPLRSLVFNPTADQPITLFLVALLGAVFLKGFN